MLRHTYFIEIRYPHLNSCIDLLYPSYNAISLGSYPGGITLFFYLRKHVNFFMLITLFSSVVIFNIISLEKYIKGDRVTQQTTIKKVHTKAPKVAITFDDGPNPASTPQILAILETKQAKATFFILGKNGEAYPELLQQMSQQGHEIGNHAYSHQRLTRLSPDGIKAEFNRTDFIITNITGQKPLSVRPPDNAYNNDIISIANELNYTFVLWSIDTRDWTNIPTSTIISKASQAQPGDIILLHDGVKPSHTIEALPGIIDVLQAKGYQLVTLENLFDSK
jgi:peptidoglycan-N-acetylglucosamine deacetylase